MLAGNANVDSVWFKDHCITEMYCWKKYLFCLCLETQL